MLPAIAVFAKAPIPGRVKTRLTAALGAEAAARLQERMVSVLLLRLIQAANRLASDVELHTDIQTDAWPGFAVTRRVQVDGDLGTRMLDALRRGLNTGRPRILILGGDVPTVPISHLEELLGMEEDVALGPAEDGGYYAICCRKTHPAMFAGVAWSTAAACAQTAAACLQAGLSVSLGSTWFDIDETEDLKRVSTLYMALPEGSKAPEINLTDESGAPFSLSSLLGKSVVLYFFPKAGTGGCTLESQEFRDKSAEFANKDAVIVGISPDNEADQMKFKTELGLPFKLLADKDHAVAEAYGVWKEKTRDGQPVMGVDRTTFLIDPDGVIRQVFGSVNPDGHAEEVLASL